MDFISRAGSLVDRGHRIVGILLVVIVIQLCWLKMILDEKQTLQNTIHHMNATQSIYVVPNSQANVYKPAEGKLLLSTFVDYLSQSLLTYTPANYAKQYASVKEFFSPTLLSVSQSYFEGEIKKADTESLSSLFVSDRTSTELSEFKELSEVSKYGGKTYEVTIKGVRHFIVGGRVLESKAQKVKIELQETTASKTNPFGFIVKRWKVLEDKTK